MKKPDGVAELEKRRAKITRILQRLQEQYVTCQEQIGDLWRKAGTGIEVEVDTSESDRGTRAADHVTWHPDERGLVVVFASSIKHLHAGVADADAGRVAYRGCTYRDDDSDEEPLAGVYHLVVKSKGWKIDSAFGGRYCVTIRLKPVEES